MLQSGLRSFRYCYDATYAEAMSAALAVPRVNKELVTIVVAYRRMVQAIAEVSGSTHTPAHQD